MKFEDMTPGDFKINPGQVTKVKKVVEVEEVQPETYTFTISRKAAQELRAITGRMSSSKISALYSEIHEPLEAALVHTKDALTFIGTTAELDMAELRPMVLVK